MMLGQLSNRESLRDLIMALETHQEKHYHFGVGRDPIAKTTFTLANQNRDYRIFEDFAFYMIEEACEKQVTNMRLIPLRFLYVWLHSLGRSTARRKVELSPISFMT